MQDDVFFIIVKKYQEIADLWKSEKRVTDFIDYEKLETYKDFGGIRIEEDLLITANGSQISDKTLSRVTGEIKKNAM